MDLKIGGGVIHRNQSVKRGGRECLQSFKEFAGDKKKEKKLVISELCCEMTSEMTKA